MVFHFRSWYVHQDPLFFGVGWGFLLYSTLFFVVRQDCKKFPSAFYRCSAYFHVLLSSVASELSRYLEGETSCVSGLVLYPFLLTVTLSTQISNFISQSHETACFSVTHQWLSIHTKSGFSSFLHVLESTTNAFKGKWLHVSSSLQFSLSVNIFLSCPGCFSSSPMSLTHFFFFWWYGWLF